MPEARKVRHESGRSTSNLKEQQRININQRNSSPAMYTNMILQRSQ